ncbi:Dihydroxy-acid dehydratase [Capsicum annuum]|nr:Dihydroxy-acid dehydratase [Capsicum annuum]KAF3670938.1 Dihydroxy-acid dehydratase [Capsicum annuum]
MGKIRVLHELLLAKQEAVIKEVPPSSASTLLVLVLDTRILETRHTGPELRSFRFDRGIFLSINLRRRIRGNSYGKVTRKENDYAEERAYYLPELEEIPMASPWCTENTSEPYGVATIRNLWSQMEETYTSRWEMPGHFQGHTFDIVSAFQVYGEYVSGAVSDAQRMNVVRNSCPGAGACGGMYTANTMASAIEALGMSLPYSSSTPAEDPLKLDECRLAGKYLLELLKMDLKPRDIITEKSLRNAMVVVMALGGSTNAVLHLIAIARSVGLELTLDDFQKVSDAVPFLADLKPSGKYVMEDVHKIGGTPAVIRHLLELGYMDGDCMTVTGKTLAENATLFPSLAEGQQIIRPLSNPIKETGHIQILYGNLAPDGSVAKITGKEGLYFSGPALVFEGEEAMLAAISEDPLSFKASQLILFPIFFIYFYPDKLENEVRRRTYECKTSISE